jgi:diacylglycerol kinase family enzyme
VANSTCVVYNPAAGRGRAKKLLENVRMWADPGAELMPTKEEFHGIELAKSAAESGFAKIVAAGGDGTVHEVANGILRAGRPEVVFGVWPLGSSNDYASALGMDRWFRSRGRGVPLANRRVDVGCLTRPGTTRFFVNCMGIGFNGMLALEARKIRWLRGLPLYSLAFVRAMLWHYRTPSVAIRWDEVETEAETLSASVNLGQREGGFPITKQALLDDGFFDTVRVGSLKRWQLMRYLPNLILGRLPDRHPKIRKGTCRRARFQATEPLCVHADGEFFARPEDGVTEFEVELLPKRLLVERAA